MIEDWLFVVGISAILIAIGVIVIITLESQVFKKEKRRL